MKTKVETADLPPAEIAGQRYQVVGIDKVREHPQNPRRGNLDTIGESIGSNGFFGAVVVQKSTGLILAGNHRWKAAKAKGLRKIPVIFVDVDDATARRILLADNRASDAAKYDNDVLLSVLRETQADQGLFGTGYAQADLARLLAASEPTTPDPTPPPEPTTGQSKIVHTCPKCSHTWTAAD